MSKNRRDTIKLEGLEITPYKYINQMINLYLPP